MCATIGKTKSRDPERSEVTSVRFDAMIRDTELVKHRLTEMFRRVPDLLAAITIEDKLKVAADALTAEHFFRACTIFLDDPKYGLYYSYAGEAFVASDRASESYRAIWNRMDGTSGAHIVPQTNIGEAESGSILIPIRNHEDRTLGIAELVYEDASLCTDEMIELTKIFLMETAQSVGQLQFERDVEKSEAMYRSLIDNVSDVIFRVDQTGRFSFVSRQIQNVLGRHWKELLGTSVVDLVSNRDKDRVRQVFEELKEGHAVSIDLTLMHRDGGEVVVFVSANPITDGGTLSGALGIARDVTDKRRLEGQIRESEQRYRALTQNAYDAILLVDPRSYTILDANPQAEKLTGYTRSELLNMSVLDLRRPERANEVKRRIAEVMGAGVGRFEDAAFIGKDGKEFFVDTAASVYELEGKRYYQAIIRDISEQKRMTEALNQRVMELQVLSEVSDALQSAVDLQSVMGIALTGVTAGKGLGFNRAFILSYDKVNNELRGEAGLGPRSAEEAGRIWTSLEAKGLTLSEILDEMIRSFPEEADASFEFARHFVVTLDDDLNVFLRAIRNREALRVNRTEADPHLAMEFLNVYTAWEFAIVPLVTRDDVMGVLLVDNLFTRREIRDEDLHRLKLFANSAASAIERSRLLISLERRLHELTLINQDLKASRDRLIRTERLSAIGEVAASVAHEIRNPLTAIGGFARTVYTSLPEKDKNRRKLAIILEETDRLEHMLSSLLEFTRPAVPRFTELDINALVMQSVHFMGTEIHPSLIQVHYQLDPNIPRAWADGQQIRQVLLNVIRNSIQEMPKGGSLTFITGEHDGEIQLAVRDTGPGIAPEHLEKIFEAFFTTKPSGSGLGLAICSQIMRNHNGRLEAFSKAGEGATFVLTLPVAQNALDSY